MFITYFPITFSNNVKATQGMNQSLSIYHNINQAIQLLGATDLKY